MVDESNLLISDLRIAIFQEKKLHYSTFLNSRRSNKAPLAVAEEPLIELFCLLFRILPSADVARVCYPLALLCVDDAT